jgi:hypothetical protein
MALSRGRAGKLCRKLLQSFSDSFEIAARRCRTYGAMMDRHRSELRAALRDMTTQAAPKTEEGNR